MDIRLTGYNDYSQVYSTNRTSAVKAAETDSATKASSKNKEDSPAAVYEKSEVQGKAATYNIRKMSSSERATIVSRMKADQEMRENSLAQTVSEMMGGQLTAYSTANDGIWKFLADGNYTVSEAAKAQAQKDIAEDGYWGVSQTSQRLFDFATALAGDDENKLKQMEEAMEKGFKEAAGAWGRDLPQLSQDTMEAARQLFSDAYANNSKENGVAVNI